MSKPTRDELLKINHNLGELNNRLRAENEELKKIIKANSKSLIERDTETYKKKQSLELESVGLKRENTQLKQQVERWKKLLSNKSVEGKDYQARDWVFVVIPRKNYNEITRELE